MSQDTRASFDVLPPEIASQICTLVRQSDVSKLSRVSKSFYQLVRPILYRHPTIAKIKALVLFSRTISEATYMGKNDVDWSTQSSQDQTKYLDLILDPTDNDGQPLPAVIISRTIHAIARRCPNLAFTFCFVNCGCRQSPVSSLGAETFPQVTKLVLYIGKRDPNEPHNFDRHVSNPDCAPNAKFWRPFVDGEVFPNCSILEIRHYWASKPPVDASLDLAIDATSDQQDPQNHFGNVIPVNRPPPAPLPLYGQRSRFRSHRWSNQRIYRPHTEQIGSTIGLGNFKSIVLECPPEIDSHLLMQLLGNPNAIASNLTTLELRFCYLDSETLSKLLYHAPPNVKRLVILCRDFLSEHVDTYPGYDGHSEPRDDVHLCPLIRGLNQELIHFEFGAPTICRQLFFDDLERRSLNDSGIETRLGTYGSAANKLDGHAIRQTIEACRKQKRTKARDSRVKEAIAATESCASPGISSNSLFGSNETFSASQIAIRAQKEAEAKIDEEEEDRARMIKGSKDPWFRRLITYHGLCNPAHTWAEMQIAADMEEEGIEWVLASKELSVASQHCNGKPAIDVDLEEAFREHYRLR